MGESLRQQRIWSLLCLPIFIGCNNSTCNFISYTSIARIKVKVNSLQLTFGSRTPGGASSSASLVCARQLSSCLDTTSSKSILVAILGDDSFFHNFLDISPPCASRVLPAASDLQRSPYRDGTISLSPFCLSPSFFTLQRLVYLVWIYSHF